MHLIQDSGDLTEEDNNSLVNRRSNSAVVSIVAIMESENAYMRLRVMTQTDRFRYSDHSVLLGYDP
ncbi:hypothetical protein L484_019408 [Morus notabilis]|uniref:Uncharacterized protein n=1 Tax=Morus notabilis TaxID=981085 RepID=W9S1N0_9ROSA|nr:hypothetical protein L484_019408 [Morus notabilis]